jgi:xanthine/uracil permease
MKETILLTVDGAVNLVLGGLLALFPRRVAMVLTIPVPDSAFYPSILGGVLLGIGLALLIHRFRGESTITGLGIEGAIAINLCGAGVLVVWLISCNLNIPGSGYAFLWSVALLVLGIGCCEIIWRVGRAKTGWNHQVTQDEGATK